MKNKIASLFRLCNFECRRILRNRIILIFLVLFPFLMALIFNSIVATENFSFAVRNELSGDPLEEIQEFMPEGYHANNLVPVDTEEEGLQKLRAGDVIFYVRLYEENEIPRANVYYYEYNYSTGLAVTKIQEFINTRAYEGVIEMLASYGITLNEAYFSPCKFIAADTVHLSTGQRTLTIQLAALVSMVILFGLAFSVARDNELGIARQTAYTPIGIHTYQLSKAIPYLVLGVYNIAVIIYTGYLGYGFYFAVSPFIVFAICCLLVPATTSLGLFICRIKSQMAVALCAFAVMVIPLLSATLQVTESFPEWIRWAFYLCPITPFSKLYETLSYTGVLDIASVILLLAQAVGYYIAASLVLKRETGK